MDWLMAAVTGGIALASGGFTLGYLIKSRQVKNGLNSTVRVSQNPRNANYVPRDVCDERHKPIATVLSKIEAQLEPLPIVYDFVRSLQRREQADREFYLNEARKRKET